MDVLLHHVAAVGLAAAAGTALLVDLDDSAPVYPGRLTVADLLADGVRRSHLGPEREGLAVLNHGGADTELAYSLVESLASGWPAVVVRTQTEQAPFPVVPLRPLLPAVWPSTSTRFVYQRLSGFDVACSDGIVLPPLRPAQVRHMLAGHVNRRWRWVHALARVWETSWD